MNAIRTTKSRKGFTLVEILIVVIILGILAAIVIPQFTNASEDARKSNMRSQLQTLRSQSSCTSSSTATGPHAGHFWTAMTTKTEEAGTRRIGDETRSARTSRAVDQPADGKQQRRGRAPRAWAGSTTRPTARSPASTRPASRRSTGD
jgi:prepilin-type N-terminal cleavage/methylation domain-containing protein